MQSHRRSTKDKNLKVGVKERGARFPGFFVIVKPMSQLLNNVEAGNNIFFSFVEITFFRKISLPVYKHRLPWRLFSFHTHISRT